MLTISMNESGSQLQKKIIQLSYYTIQFIAFKILGYAGLRKCRFYFQGDHDTTRKNLIPIIDWSNKDEVLTQ